MGLEEKSDLYELYLTGPVVTIKKDVKGSMFKLVFNKCWGYQDSMKDTSFYTLSKPLGTNNVSYKEIDLSPVANMIVYHVTIKR